MISKSILHHKIPEKPGADGMGLVYKKQAGKS